MLGLGFRSGVTIAMRFVFTDALRLPLPITTTFGL